MAQLAKKGWHVLLLQRRNHLDHVLGHLSRKATGEMHCLRDCDPFSLNTSVALQCNSTVQRMSEWHETNLEFDREFQARAARGRGNCMRHLFRAASPTRCFLVWQRWEQTQRFTLLEYEQLLASPRGWARAMAMLGFASHDACKLSTPRQKRV